MDLQWRVSQANPKATYQGHGKCPRQEDPRFLAPRKENTVMGYAVVVASSSNQRAYPLWAIDLVRARAN